MPGKIPVYDRLGCRRTWNNNEWAQKNPITTFPPNNETVLLINWIRCQRAALVAGDHFQSLHLHRDITGEGVAMQRNLDNLKLGSYDTAWQQHTIAIPDNMDHQWCVVVDRDNTLLDAYLDGDLGGRTAALTENPDLTAAVMHNLNNSTAEQYSDITWRCVAMTIANGSTPTQAAMSQILKQWLDPQSAMPADLTAIKGSYYSDYTPCTNSSGSTTITDNGDNGDNLTWQGGFSEGTARARATVPKRIPRRTFYALTPGYTATTGNVDFSLAVQPVVWRVQFKRIGHADHTGVSLANAAGTVYIRLETVSGAQRLAVDDGTAEQTLSWADFHSQRGGDLVVSCSGTTCNVYMSGGLVHTFTLAAAMDFTGDCVVTMDGRTDCGRIEVYNPASLPGTFTDDIVTCVRHPEMDIPNLTSVVDYPIHSGLIAAGGTTVAGQGTGGGTLTLSDTRANACAEFAHGMDP